MTETVLVTVKAQMLQGISTAMLGEQFNVKVGSLEDVLAVLTRFHELAERIRDEQAGLAKA